MAEWEQEFGSDSPERVDALLATLVEGRMARAMSATQRAQMAWYKANGDRERAHTRGVFLKRPRVAGAAPILGVYVDTHAMATDFGVNKDIYLARLANVGFAVSGIDFLVSRNPGKVPERRPSAKPIPAPEPPELTDQERSEVDALVEGLPADLRAVAARAIEATKRAGKRA